MPRALLGVNLPYFYGAYGHDLAPSLRFPTWPVDFDVMKAYRPMLEAKAIGLDAVRIWLCEGAEGMVQDTSSALTGVHPMLLDAITMLQEGAQVAGVRIYWTLLDANSASRDGDTITRSILVDRDQAERFAQNVVRPIARAIDPEVSVGLEVVNEPEVLTDGCKDVQPVDLPTVPWEVLGHTLRVARHAALSEQSALLITAGTGHAFLPELWKSGAGLTAVDIHMYHRDGGLPSRQDLASYVGDPDLLTLPLIAGECGITKPDYDEDALRNYLVNADGLGYSAAFLWKLEGELIDAKSAGRPLTETATRIRAELARRPDAGFAHDGQ